MNTKIKLDSVERQIERSAASYHPVSKKERRKIEALLARIRKRRPPQRTTSGSGPGTLQ